MAVDGDEDSVRVFVGRRKSRDPTSGIDFREFRPTAYDVTLDMLEVADGFSLTFPFDRQLWKWSAPDNPIVIELNGRPVLTGLLDDSVRTLGRDGSMIVLSGRDKGGRLVDDAAPLIKFAGMTILDLAERMTDRWFPEVELQNATNRRLLVGGRPAKASREPAIANSSTGKKKVNPGESRSQVLEWWLSEAGLLGWSSADGKLFIVGRPNYTQEPQFALFAPKPDSNRSADGTILELRHKETSGERYARIIVLGSGAGDATNYAENVQRRGIALQGPNPDGTGGAFVVPKDLIILDEDLKSAAAAQKRAADEMALRESQALEVECTVVGHSQKMGINAHRSNYAPDTMVRFEDEEIASGGNPRDFLITRLQYTGGRSGRTTRLTLVPKGTDLRLTYG